MTNLNAKNTSQETSHCPLITLYTRECTGTLQHYIIPQILELHLSNFLALSRGFVHAANSASNQNCLLGLFTTSDALNMAHDSFDPGYYLQFLFTIFLIRSRFARFEAADAYESFGLHERELVRSQ
jgi:hypothetical protein